MPKETLSNDLHITFNENPRTNSQQLCCISCGYKSRQDVEDNIQNCSRATKQSDVDHMDCTVATKHEWAAYHTCSNDSHRCSSWVSGQLQVWSQQRKEKEQPSALDSLSDTHFRTTYTMEDSFGPVLDDTEVLTRRPITSDENIDNGDFDETNESLDKTTPADPAEMTFVKRKQSSSKRTPVAKKGKLEHAVVDYSKTGGLDKTWRPEFDVGKYRYPDSDESDDDTKDQAGACPTVCTNCNDAKAPVGRCMDPECRDDPYLCDPCVWAHKRVGQTRNHQISFELSQVQMNQDDEDAVKIFETILNSVHPGRKSNEVSSGSETDFDELPDIPVLADELRLIRQNSSTLVHHLIKSNSRQESRCVNGHPCAESRIGGLECHDIRMPEAFSRSSSQSGSNGGSYKPRRARASSIKEFSGSGSDSSDSGSSANGKKKVSSLTERIIADNLLPILNVDSDEVKMKTAVVIEMLVKGDVVNPSVFCDNRGIQGFRSLLSSKDKRILKTALASLDQFITALGRKGIFFALVKIEAELRDTLKEIQEQDDIKDSVNTIQKTLDRFFFN